MSGSGFMYSIINSISILSTVTISNCELYLLYSPWTISKKSTKYFEEISTGSTLY